jgi:transposase-like protein
MQIPNKSGRRYDRDFKENAVALVRSDRTITDASRDMALFDWARTDAVYCRDATGQVGV